MTCPASSGGRDSQRSGQKSTRGLNGPNRPEGNLAGQIGDHLPGYSEAGCAQEEHSHLNPILMLPASLLIIPARQREQCSIDENRKHGTNNLVRKLTRDARAAVPKPGAELVGNAEQGVILHEKRTSQWFNGSRARNALPLPRCRRRNQSNSHRRSFRLFASLPGCRAGGGQPRRAYPRKARPLPCDLPQSDPLWSGVAHVGL